MKVGGTRPRPKNLVFKNLKLRDNVRLFLWRQQRRLIHKECQCRTVTGENIVQPLWNV